jgi:hypothetical protein
MKTIQLRTGFDEKQIGKTHYLNEAGTHTKCGLAVTTLIVGGHGRFLYQETTHKVDCGRCLRGQGL